jgi:hypothetical protein
MELFLEEVGDGVEKIRKEERHHQWSDDELEFDDQSADHYNNRQRNNKFRICAPAWGCGIGCLFHSFQVLIGKNNADSILSKMDDFTNKKPRRYLRGWVFREISSQK